MGLFSFLKNAGAKILTGKGVKEVPVPAPPTNASKDAYNTKEVLRRQRMILLRGVIDSLGLKARDLEIDLNGSKVTVYGKVKNQAEKEKVVLALGNVAGIATVDDRLIVKNPEPEAVFYTVKSGDSLSKIAKKFYKDAKKYDIILSIDRPLNEIQSLRVLRA